MKIQRILLPTDLSESADRALEQAVELAAQHRAKIDILHVVTLPHFDAAEARSALDAYMAKVEKEVFDDLATRSDAIRTRGLAVSTVIVRRSYPAEAILENVTEAEPDLVVMGTHGRSGLRKLLLGSVAARIVLEAPCPVMTVASDARIAEGENGFDPILVPVDFTEHSERAIEAANALRAPSGRLILEHVVSSPVHPSLYAGGVSKLLELQPELASVIGKKLSELFQGPSEIVVTEGSIVEEILAISGRWKAQLIVMGTRGLNRQDYLLLGSVTERVIGRAKVPVLAIK
jgi:nucleotide-binding universal stress UspA family protein